MHNWHMGGGWGRNPLAPELTAAMTPSIMSDTAQECITFGRSYLLND